MPEVHVTSGLVFGSQNSLRWSVQQTSVRAHAAPKNYLVHYVGLRIKQAAAGRTLRVRYAVYASAGW